ncbi:MAG: serine/threonine-protein kinase [Sandaracinaceae bacterium]
MTYCPRCDGPTGPDAPCPVCGELAEDGWPEDPRIGEVLDGRYELRERLAAGGYGVVFAARHREAGLDLGDVAVKMLRPSLRERAERFLKEAEAARAVQSPHALAIHGIGKTDDGLPFVVMPLLRGRTLSRGVRWPPDEVVAIAADVAEALAAIHAAGLVHRDVKPANVHRSDEGFVTLLDFGIARRASELRDGTANAGTVAYMAPEHRAGELVDGKADVYSLGVLIHEMLTGRRPASETSVTLEGDLGRVVRRMLAELPEERPTAAQLVALLRGERREAATETLDDVAPEPRSSPDEAAPVEAPVERRPAGRGGWIALVAAALVVAGVIGGIWWAGEPPTRSATAERADPPAPPAPAAPTPAPLAERAPPTIEDAPEALEPAAPPSAASRHRPSATPRREWAPLLDGPPRRDER